MTPRPPGGTPSGRTADCGEPEIADAVLDLAEKDSCLSDEATLLVMAALDSETELAAALNQDRTAPSIEQGSATDQAIEPVGAYLSSITVRGFRGIGPQSVLPLHPGPGLTIVAGRNGSGKSSFAEALELALTGNTFRWNKKKHQSWFKHWRNLHCGTPCEIRVRLAEDGVGITTVGVDWAPGAELGDRKTWTQRPGQRREDGIQALGWDRALELYRPILSYHELGGLFDAGPSELFDKIDAILGIEQATDAHRRLDDQSKSLSRPETGLKAETRILKNALGSIDDERAAQALVLLRKRQPDIDAVRAIATGTSTHPPVELMALKAAATVELPSREDLALIAARLRMAVNEAAHLGASVIDAGERRTALLRQALDFHRHHGDGPCPVCRDGTIDSAWHRRTEAELASKDATQRRRSEAEHALRARRAEAIHLVNAVPEPNSLSLPAAAAAHAAWQRWSRPPVDDSELAVHLDTYPDVASTVENLRLRAAIELADREDAWAPCAIRLAEWVGLATTVLRQQPQLTALRAATAFLTTAVTQLRQTRLERLSDHAREIWAALRQEGNVDLGAISLEGRGTRRHVQLSAAVDGEQSQALGVMSQGELHALGLALFLPRATMPDSPFRFVVLDDPIQAMDPSKVDGFARVLQDLAKNHQVVVLSHDDRLPQAVRDLGMDARIVQVCRDTDSAVDVSDCHDQAGRHLDDAFAIAADPNVPHDVKKRVIPTLCRLAVESAARDVYLTRRFAKGDTRIAAEAAWQDARRTRSQLALAIRDDKSADIDRWLGSAASRQAGLRTITRGMHGGIQEDCTDAVRQVRRLVDDLKACRP